MDTTPPPGVDVPGAQWIRIHGAGGVAKSEQVAAVFRPPGPGPFPLVIDLHGGSGLTDAGVKRASRVAAAGFVAVAGCWQSSYVPPYTFQMYGRTVTKIGCPKLLASDADAIAALVAAGRQQPGVRADAVGLVGSSGGGLAALKAVAARKDIRAAVLDSPAVDSGVPEASMINVPVLLLAGTSDDRVDFTVQKNYVEALQRAGKDVEYHFYDGGRHVLTLDPVTEEDAIHRIIEFLTRHLNANT